MDMDPKPGNSRQGFQCANPDLKQEAKGKNGVDPPLSIFEAAEEGQAEMVASWLKKGFYPVNQRNSEGFTALDLASQNGHLNIVLMLLEIWGIKVWIPNGEKNPLLLAAKNGHKLIVEVLIESHSVYKYTDFDDFEIVTKYFLIEAEDRSGRTALHLAAENGHLEIVESWVFWESKISQDKQKNTPLHLAAKEGHAEVVAYLLNPRYKFDTTKLEQVSFINCRNKAGETALHLAAERGHSQVIDKLLKHDEIKVNATCQLGRTALHLATTNGHEEAILSLMEHKKLADFEDWSGKRALDIACEKGLSTQIQRCFKIRFMQRICQHCEKMTK